MSIPIVCIDVTYVITSWITLYYVLIMGVSNHLKGNKVWMIVVHWTYVCKMNYLDSNEAISIVLLCCWWQGFPIPNPIHLNYLGSMYVCYGMVVIWLKGSSHDYNVSLSWKVYSLASVSRMKNHSHLWTPIELFL